MYIRRTLNDTLSAKLNETCCRVMVINKRKSKLIEEYISNDIEPFVIKTNISIMFRIIIYKNTFNAQGSSLFYYRL